jgi:hypothetical protein
MAEDVTDLRAITHIATAKLGTACHVEQRVCCRSGACRRDSRAGEQRSYSDEDDGLVLNGRIRWSTDSVPGP